MRLSGELATDRSCGSEFRPVRPRQRRVVGRGDRATRVAIRDLPACVRCGEPVGKRRPPPRPKRVCAPGLRSSGEPTRNWRFWGAAAPRPASSLWWGTFWQTAWLAERPLIDPARCLRTLCHVLPGLWMTEGIGFLNGLAMRWLRDTVFSSALTADGIDPYAAMESLAAQVPAGADGVFALVSDVMHARAWRQAPMTVIGIDVTRPGHSGERGRGLRFVPRKTVPPSRPWPIIASWRSCRETASELIFCGGASKGNLGRRSWQMPSTCR